MTKQRKELFLAELGRTGVFAQAARIASPHTKHGALNSFRAERERDPDFAAAWDEAIDVSTGIIEQEAIRRAVHGWDDGKVRKYSDRLMELILKRRDPAYQERRKYEVAAKIDKPMDLRSLSAEKRELLEKLLDPCQHLGPAAATNVTPTTTEPSDDRAPDSLSEDL